MATKKKASAAEAKVSTKSKKAKESKGDDELVAIPKGLEGDALVCHVLQRAEISLEDANAAKPGDQIDAYLLEADRAIAAYRKAHDAFADDVPTFDISLASVAATLLEHAKDESSTWSKMRFSKSKGEGRGVSRKEAEKLRAKVLKLSRFVFRRNKAVLAEIERIAAGEGLADLITDLDDMVKLISAHPATFAKLKKLKGAAERAAELAVILRTMSDGVPAANQLASRNRAVEALGVALEEIRKGAKFLYEDDSPKALLPYLTSTTSRTRAARPAAKPKKAPVEI